jgi:Fungal specific transcription factor domain
LLPASILSQQTTDIALNYFMRTFIPGSHFEYLPDILRQYSSSQCIISTTHAVALANLARETQDSHLMSTAKMVYSQAITEISAALKTDQIRSDSTLVSGLVLGLFEVSSS